MLNIEAIFLKAWGIVQPHYPIFAGTLFHMLFIGRKDKLDGVTKRTYFDTVSLIIMSFLLGMLGQTILIGYFDLKGLEVKDTVLLSFGVIMALIGFPGLVWFVMLIKGLAKEWLGELFQAVLRKYFPVKEAPTSREGYTKWEDEDEYRDR